MESLVNLFMSTLGQYIPRELLVFIISLFPVLELRGGMLASVLLDLPYVRGLVCSVLGNIVPIPFILFFIKKIFAWMKQFKIFQGLVAKMENKALKNKDKVQKYKFWGLVLFVGIPLPMTGAWTGALVAALFDMDIKEAVKAILLGIVMAAVIMTIVSYGVVGNIVH